MDTDTQNSGCCGAHDGTDAKGFDPAAMIEHCRRMFGGAFGSFAAPAEEKEEGSTGTAAPKGCSGTKEV